MTKRMVLILSIVVCCLALVARATDTPRMADNNGAVLYLSLAPELSYDDTTTYRGLSATPSPAEAIVTAEPSEQTQIAYVLAAFPEKAVPEMSVVSFGIRYSEGTRVVRYGITKECLQMGTRDWPLSTEGMMIGVLEDADTTDVMEVGWLAIKATKPGLLEIVPHPDPRMGARVVGVRPPVQTAIAAFGHLGIGQPGFAPEPLETSPEIGAACVNDSVCIMVTRDEAAYYEPRYADTGGLVFLGEEIICRGNPCGTGSPEGACCLENDECVVLSLKDCVIWGGRFMRYSKSCDPNPCGADAPTEEGESEEK